MYVRSKGIDKWKGICYLPVQDEKIRTEILAKHDLADIWSPSSDTDRVVWIQAILFFTFFTMSIGMSWCGRD